MNCLGGTHPSECRYAGNKLDRSSLSCRRGLHAVSPLGLEGPELPVMHIYGDAEGEQCEVISPTCHPLSVEY
jgi:hypothetical protein